MNPYLTNVVEFGPQLIARSFRRLPADRVDRPTHPGRFSPREVLAHLADWEPIFLHRMRQAVAEPGSTLAVYDEGERAVALGYAATDPEESLSIFAQARRETAEWLRALPGDAYDRRADHPEKGVLSVTDMAHMLLGHDIYHIAQLEEAAE